MNALSDDTAVDTGPLADEGLAPPPAVFPDGLVARLRRLVLRTSVPAQPRVAKRPAFREDVGPPRFDMDAGLTRGASLLFGADPRRR